MRTLNLRWLLWAALFFCCLANAQPAAPLTPSRASAADKEPKTCLVLSGGGARGLAHIGVLRRIEALRIPIHCVAGTSMGSVIGGLYASGMSADAIEALLLHVDWTELAGDRVDRELLPPNRKRDDYNYPLGLEMGIKDGQFRLSTGLLSGVRFEMLLRKWLPDANDLIEFDHLPIPFRAVAADIETGAAVVLSQGRLVDAIRASMAVPGLFSPVELNGKGLIDGGVAMNLPITVARSMGAARIIAVDVSTPPIRKNQIKGLLQVYQQMTAFLVSGNVKAQIALMQPQDLLISPDLSGMGFDEFDKLAQFIASGRAAATAVETKLLAFSVEARAFALYREDLTRPGRRQAITVSRVEIAPQTYIPETAIRELTALDTPAKLDAKTLDEAASNLLATGDFERVSFTQHRDAEGAWLEIDAKEKSWGPNYLRFGLNTSLGNDGNGAIGLSLGHLRTWANAAGAEWRNDLTLGRTLGAATEWYQPFSVTSPWFAAARYAFLQRPMEFTLSTFSNKPAWRARNVTNDLSLDLGYQLSQWGEIRAGLKGHMYRMITEVGGIPYYDSATNTAGFLPVQLSGREIGGNLSLYLDRLDSPFLPRKGFRITAEAFVGRTTDRSGTDTSNDTIRRFNADGQASFSWGELTFNPRLRYATVQGLNGVAPADITLGGFQALSGTPMDSLAGSKLIFGRLDTYYALSQVDLFGRRLFAGGTLEAGSLNNAFSWTDSDAGRVRKAFSLYVAMQSALGPLYAAYGKTIGGSSAIYLFLGRP